MPGLTRIRNLRLAAVTAALGVFVSPSLESTSSPRPADRVPAWRLAPGVYKYVVSGPFTISANHVGGPSLKCPASASDPISGEYRVLGRAPLNVWPAESYAHGRGWVTDVSNRSGNASAQAQVGLVCANSSSDGYEYRYRKAVRLGTGGTTGAFIRCPQSAPNPISGQFSSNTDDVFPFGSHEVKGGWEISVTNDGPPAMAQLGAVCGGPSTHGIKYVVSKRFTIAEGTFHELAVECPASAPIPISGQFINDSSDVWPRTSYESDGGWVTDLDNTGPVSATSQVGVVCVR